MVETLTKSETSDFPWSLSAITRNAYLVCGSRSDAVYEVAALPVSATSTLRLDWVADALYSILYPVMESSPGSSQVSATESVVEVASKFVGMAGGGGLLVETLTKSETSDSP